MSSPLYGVTVVVTRPSAQARPFVAMARESGARCVEFPTLAIERLPLAPEARSRLSGATWDCVVWTSTNAVDAAFEEVGPIRARCHAAVGRATARALERRGVTPTLRPESANSEGLLALPQMRDVGGKSVLLVKGAGGRDLIRTTLVARGAHLESVEIYRRRLADPAPADVSALRGALAGAPAVVAVTSVDVLEALLQVAPQDALAGLRRSTLLVPGERVAASAAAAGWQGEIVEARTAEDAAMLEALEAWARRRSPTP